LKTLLLTAAALVGLAVPANADDLLFGGGNVAGTSNLCGFTGDLAHDEASCFGKKDPCGFNFDEHDDKACAEKLAAADAARRKATDELLKRSDEDRRARALAACNAEPTIIGVVLCRWDVR